MIAAVRDCLKTPELPNRRAYELLKRGTVGLFFAVSHRQTPASEANERLFRQSLKAQKLPPHLLWEQVQPLLELDPEAYLIFDDTVLDKSFGPKIEMVRKQWSGNEKGVIGGMGVVSCVYVNPKTEHFWVVDYRIFDPEADGESKLDHVKEMLRSAEHRRLAFQAVLIDSWYATKDLMLLIDGMQKTFYCPLKSNRQVDDSGGERPYQRVDTLEWSKQELERGKLIKVKGFPKDYKVKLFRVVASSNRTEWLVTNDLSQDYTHETQEVRGVRWKIEEFHREAKQVDRDRELPVSRWAHPTQP